MTELQRKIQDALRRNRINSRNLSAFAMDVTEYLRQTELFTEIHVTKTGKPDQALDIHCELARNTVAPSEVAQTLKRVWEEAPLGYGNDSYEVTEKDANVQMRFLAVSDDGLIATGCINVSGFKSE